VSRSNKCDAVDWIHVTDTFGHRNVLLMFSFDIWGSHSGYCEDCCPVGYNTYCVVC